MTLPIFLAEDDATLRGQLIALIDETCDAHVVATADTEASATAWMHEHPKDWDLAVLDLFLRQGTGFGVLENMKDPAERDRVIVLTNSATKEHRARCLALGARAVYDKTLELDRFLEHCRRHNRQRKVRTT
ncbi:response regulator [Variovorax sp. J22R133]|uniref:response regulator n=1 Tax=Variovorax brevis TaxID=3053503 RepID=UPI002577D291|nr:response regulator [Variovorax sp. J22R133]MDM0111382.1 response regulator [Variovorax sp. J22R133]